MNEALDLVDQNLPDLFQKLIDRALEGDREAQIYLIDRRLGKPKTDIDLTGGDQLGTGLVTELFKLLAQKRQEFIDFKPKQIEEGKDATEQS